MDSFAVDVSGERQVGLTLDAFPGGLYEDLRVEIDGLAAELFVLVVAATPERSGRLRSEERVRLFADPRRITGQVLVAASGADAAKAGALEYGAHRATAVRAHQMRLDHLWGQRLAAPMTVIVGAYERTPDIAEHAFERGPLHAMQPQVLARLTAVVERDVAKANR